MNLKQLINRKIIKVRNYRYSEGLGTTGKVFKSQKEALEFGKQEIKRLAEGDKKSRQFSISKVTCRRWEFSRLDCRCI